MEKILQRLQGLGESVSDLQEDVKQMPRGPEMPRREAVAEREEVKQMSRGPVSDLQEDVMAWVPRMPQSELGDVDIGAKREDDKQMAWGSRVPQGEPVETEIVHAGTMRAPPRAHDQSDRFLELLRAWTSSSTLSPSSRSRASSTDGHYHRRRRSHHRLRYRRALIMVNIAVVIAIFMIGADVADVILSSRTSEYRRHA